MITFTEIEKYIKLLLEKYRADHALLFGSYARGEATSDSDLDVVVFGGKDFHPSDVFAFGEDLRMMTGKSADVFEIRELDPGTDFYNAVMKEGIRIA